MYPDLKGKVAIVTGAGRHKDWAKPLRESSPKTARGW